MLGYDTYMIFVNTSLEVALQRNRVRTRSVPEDITRKSWNTVQNNIGKFQNMFGMRNMIVVDNNDAKEDELLKVYKQVRRLINVPVQNYVAKKWIENELRLKRQNAR
jgi:predicted kinase